MPRPLARKNGYYNSGCDDPQTAAYRELKLREKYGPDHAIRAWDALHNKDRSRWRQIYSNGVRNGEIKRAVVVATVASIPDSDLVSRAIANLRNTEPHARPRWDVASSVFGLGSTYAAQLCARFDKDPDEVLPGRECQMCAEMADAE